MTCNFSSLAWPGRSAPTALASLLFNLPEPQTTGKPYAFFFAIFYFLALLSSDFLGLSFSLLFSSLTLPISALPSVHIEGSLTSALPSVM